MKADNPEQNYPRLTKMAEVPICWITKMVPSFTKLFESESDMQEWMQVHQKRVANPYWPFDSEEEFRIYEYSASNNHSLSAGRDLINLLKRPLFNIEALKDVTFDGLVRKCESLTTIPWNEVKDFIKLSWRLCSSMIGRLQWLTMTRMRRCLVQ